MRPAGVQPIGRRLRGGIERAAMPARRRALRDQRIDAAGDRHLGLRQCRDGADGADAGGTQPLAFVGARQAESERDRLRAHIEHHVQLRRPVVVVVAGFAEAGAVALRLIGKGRRVALDRRGCARTGLWHKEIDAQRARRQSARRRDALGEHLGSQVTGRDETEPAGVRSGRRQFGRRRPARHRGDDHRNSEVADVEPGHHRTAFANRRTSCGSALMFGRMT